MIGGFLLGQVISVGIVERHGLTAVYTMGGCASVAALGLLTKVRESCPLEKRKAASIPNPFSFLRLLKAKATFRVFLTLLLQRASSVSFLMDFLATFNSSVLKLDEKTMAANGGISAACFVIGSLTMPKVSKCFGAHVGRRIGNISSMSLLVNTGLKAIVGDSKILTIINRFLLISCSGAEFTNFTHLVDQAASPEVGMQKAETLAALTCTVALLRAIIPYIYTKIMLRGIESKKTGLVAMPFMIAAGMSFLSEFLSSTESAPPATSKQVKEVSDVPCKDVETPMLECTNNGKPPCLEETSAN